MAATSIARSLIFSHLSPSLSLYHRLFYSSRSHLHISTPLPSFKIIALPLYQRFLTPSVKSFCSNSETVNTPKRNPRLVNFSLSDSDSDSDDQTAKTTAAEVDKSKMPPPYDPFSKKNAISEPEDPKNLQEVFHKIRSEGLFNSAVKMFDGLSKEGLTHEALELFAQIKDKGQMPDVVAHTAVIEAYANAGQAKEALKVYRRMLASGVMPNAYTYTVLIKGLAGSGEGKMVEEARRCVAEMVGKGMRPNVGAYVAVLEGLAREGRGEEGREFVEEMGRMGFVAEEKAVREVVREKRGPVVRSVMDMLFGK
ncbi:Pentatricopeptide repeat-containing protein [Actinidia chinensis var. chinensis]|uniref:Pentatricopeptide repeat-containing protein n=1 Tax=Actinidia chinensis var. chinensis TaxID=1590841 RepID=A0A2R6QIH9_ACTCC|nr:Pentatricopeptide repeat-containing protein [Actinidia chinensis var. chinensis]